MNIVGYEDETVKAKKPRCDNVMSSDCHDSMVGALGRQSILDDFVSYRGGELLPPVAAGSTVEMVGRFRLDCLACCRILVAGGDQLDDEWETVLSGIDWSYQPDGMMLDGLTGGESGESDDEILRGWVLFRALCSSSQSVADSDATVS